MNRKEFLELGKAFGILVGFPAAMVGTAVAEQKIRPPQKYSFRGHLTPHDPDSFDVEYLTLDGQRIEANTVFAADDVEGWISRRIPEAERKERGPAQHAEYLTGVVRFHWRKEA